MAFAHNLAQDYVCVGVTNQIIIFGCKKAAKVSSLRWRCRVSCCLDYEHKYTKIGGRLPGPRCIIFFGGCRQKLPQQNILMEKNPLNFRAYNGGARSHVVKIVNNFSRELEGVSRAPSAGFCSDGVTKKCHNKIL